MNPMKGNFLTPASFPLNYRMQSPAASVWFATPSFTDQKNCMSAIAIKKPFDPAAGRDLRFSLLLGAMLLWMGFITPPTAVADEVDDVEAAVVKLATKQEKEGFDFRADIWERQLTPDLGKAVRVQFFKGNEYRVCVAVPPQSGVQIAAHVLDMEGRPVESKAESADGGWGVTLSVKPDRTGVYVVVVRRSGGKEKATICAMINGYK
jgi:hypothetical protein